MQAVGTLSPCTMGVNDMQRPGPPAGIALSTEVDRPVPSHPGLPLRRAAEYPAAFRIRTRPHRAYEGGRTRG
jgi:hypothetical protein